MAGHSKWETTKRQKGANDAKRGALFTKLGNQIAIAARAGGDITMNPALSIAVENARAANMPNANIQRAIDRVTDKNAANLDEITYEGYGPAGVGIIIETATDNRNRTLPEVKTALVKNGGRIADAGSVMFQFTRKGVIFVEASGEDALLTILDAGAEDANETDGEIVVYTEDSAMTKVRQDIIDSGLKVLDAKLQYVANADIDIDDPETAKKLDKLLDALDDVADVSNIHTNANITIDF